MENQQFIELLREELPGVLRRDRRVREWVLEVTRGVYAEQGETESRFDQVLAELRQLREEGERKWAAQERKWAAQERKWAENQQVLRQMQEEESRKWAEQERKWAENQQVLRQMQEEESRKWAEQERRWEAQERKWAENQQVLRQMQEEWNHRWEENQRLLLRMQDAIDAQAKRHDSSIGALGARWGVYSEQAFRHALEGILTASFGVQVLNVTEYDDAGEVFGRPDQVELDVIIQDGTLILMEIKSSMSKADVYIFDRKVAFYEKRHGRQAARKLVISPMVDEGAREVAGRLGVEVYSHAEESMAGGADD